MAADADEDNRQQILSVCLLLMLLTLGKMNQTVISHNESIFDWWLC